jgi:hypothetical protein
MRPPRIVIGAVTLGICLAVILFWLGLRNAPKKGDEIWLEVAKAGLQLGVVTIVGGGIAASLKHLEATREQRRQLSDYRLGILRSVVTSYNRIKAVRRILRAHGFRSSAVDNLTAEQVSAFDSQLQHLNEEQLTLEATYRDIEAQPALFTNSACIQSALKTVEEYLHGVIQDWEDHGAEVVAHAPANVLNKMSQLQTFLGSSKLGFKSGAGTPMEMLGKEMGLQLLSVNEAAPKPGSLKP